MKKKLAIVLPLVLILGIVIFIVFFCRVRFMDDSSMGFIIKYEDETVIASIFTGVYNGSFSEKTITFEVRGGGEYKNNDLKYEKYYDIQIEITRGNAQISAQGNYITIPPGEEVEIIITAYNEYIGDELKGQLVSLSREAPEDVRIVIVDMLDQ